MKVNKSKYKNKKFYKDNYLGLFIIPYFIRKNLLIEI